MLLSLIAKGAFFSRKLLFAFLIEFQSLIQLIFLISLINFGGPPRIKVNVCAEVFAGSDL